MLSVIIQTNSVLSHGSLKSEYLSHLRQSEKAQLWKKDTGKGMDLFLEPSEMNTTLLTPGF